MNNQKYRNKIIQFLYANGYQEYDDYIYTKNDMLAIELSEKEIVLLSDEGDVLHLPLNYFALVGALIELRQVGSDYKAGRLEREE